MSTLPAPVLIVLALLLGLAAPAHASPQEAIKDCAQDGTVDGSYSNSELREASRTVPADIDSYTECSSTLANAVSSGRSGGDGGSPNGDTRPDGSPVEGSSSSNGGNGSGSDGGSDSGAGGSGEGGSGSNGGSDDAKADRDPKQLAGGGPQAGDRDRSVQPPSGALAQSDDGGLSLPLLLALVALALLLVAGTVLALNKRNPAAFAGMRERLPNGLRRGPFSRDKP